MSAEIELHLVAHGDVQGVGYRATVAYHARSLGLAGTVSNLRDGSVEIYIQGQKEKVDQFLGLIQEQAGAADVQRLSSEEEPTLNSYSGFRII